MFPSGLSFPGKGFWLRESGFLIVFILKCDFTCNVNENNCWSATHRKTDGHIRPLYALPALLGKEECKELLMKG